MISININELSLFRYEMSSGKIEKQFIKILNRNNYSQDIPIIDSNKFQNENSFIQNDRDEFYEYLEIIKEIHIILLEYSNLTHKERFSYCNSQRYFMKAYLKRLIEKKRN